MKSISTVGSLVGAAALAVFLAGCDNTQEGLKRDAQENQRKAEAAAVDARQKASEANEKAGQSVKDAAENVGQAVENAAKSAGHAVGDAAATSAAGCDLSNPRTVSSSVPRRCRLTAAPLAVNVNA